MNPYIINPYLVEAVRQQQEEFIRQIQIERLIKLASSYAHPRKNRTAKILIGIGKLMESLGAYLVEQNSIQPESGKTFQQEIYPDGISLKV